MPTQCSRDLFGYEVVEGRQVVAGFDGGDHTTDAGALLLGATDRAIGLVGRFASCFADVAPRRRSSIPSRPWWRSGCSVSRSATRT
jgi:hypothetical protein